VTRREDLSFDVRPARPGDEVAIARVCRAGFVLSSRGLLPPDVVQRQAAHYYDVERIRREIAPRPDDPSWQGYVVAVSAHGEVLGAAGGGVGDGHVGNVLVLYVDTELRGHGIGSALLDHLTDQQGDAGATQQWVSVTKGNTLAIPFYRARGFVERGEVPYVAADSDEPSGTTLRMSRPVEPAGTAREPGS
jgi:ribosomal protein S18 acetylase RimI-like enzyme